ncbi:MAG: hypothetical protein Ct9H300mP23_01050 [Nitrospinota bacterium]|nr:MAG: hypothetical protein Ct9H300mP23_01050 [Nitrospinota bacterium]
MLDFLNPPNAEIHFGTGNGIFLSTADAKGECDPSFRAGPKSFVKVLDNKTLIFPGKFKGTVSWQVWETYRKIQK